MKPSTPPEKLLLTCLACEKRYPDCYQWSPGMVSMLNGLSDEDRAAEFADEVAVVPPVESGPTEIPPPEDSDYDCELEVLYHFHSINPKRKTDAVCRSLIRRCHAAEMARDVALEQLQAHESVVGEKV